MRDPWFDDISYLSGRFVRHQLYKQLASLFEYIDLSHALNGFGGTLEAPLPKCISQSQNGMSGAIIAGVTSSAASGTDFKRP